MPQAYSTLCACACVCVHVCVWIKSVTPNIFDTHSKLSVCACNKGIIKALWLNLIVLGFWFNALYFSCVICLPMLWCFPDFSGSLLTYSSETWINAMATQVQTTIYTLVLVQISTESAHIIGAKCPAFDRTASLLYVYNDLLFRFTNFCPAKKHCTHKYFISTVSGVVF